MGEWAIRTLLVTMSTGWAIRNFVHTGILAQIARSCRVVALAARSDNPDLIEQCRRDGIELYPLHLGEEPAVSRIIRRTRKGIFTSLRRIETESIRRRSTPGLMRKITGAASDAVAAVPGAELLLPWLERLDQRTCGASVRCREILRHNPSLVLILAPFSYHDIHIAYCGFHLGVPVAAMIPSWDNVSTKGVISSRYSQIMVWSQRQKREVLDAYPLYSEDQVIVTGIPQFDIYAADLAHDFMREQYLSSLGIAPNKRVLLYGTSPSRLFPEEQEVVSHLAEAVETGALPADVHILVRCHPNDSPTRYEALRRYPHITVWAPSRQAEETPNTWVPPEGELLHLSAMLRHSVMSISTASTLALDSAACDVPIINVCYDGNREKTYHTSVRRYYDYSHYRPVVDSGAVVLAKNHDELMRLVLRTLEHPDEKRIERKRLVLDLCGFSPGSASERIADLVTTWALNGG